MDSKKQYSSKVALQKFIAEKDPDLLSKIAAGVARSAKWSDSWATVDINEIVDKYAFGAKATVNGGKIEFHGERYDVIADVGGGYLRIFDKQLKAYVDADGNDVRNIEKNGKIKGRSRSEQQRLTHFAIKKGEEK